VSGIARACRENGCALLGGETAEMPGFYADADYDLAGFIVGVVDRGRVIDGRAVATGDRLIGLASAGLHTNGYSLARRIVFDRLGLTVDAPLPGLSCSVGEALLGPHRSYLRTVKPLVQRGLVRGMAHITGGGITDNLPRTLPRGAAAVIERDAWTVPPLFTFLQQAGGVPEEDMLRTFNMGIGMILVVAPERLEEALALLDASGERDASVIGRIVGGSPGVRYVTR
jgi:phosphoribosylformylglycinamidine cyclo-ligase